MRQQQQSQAGGTVGPVVVHVTRCRPTRHEGRPEKGFTLGQVLRHQIWDTAAVPASAPGYRVLPDGTVSAIVTIVAELEPEYCRAEDGNAPPELVGRDGWVFTGAARLATPDEAARVLEAEARAARREELTIRLRQLLDHRSPDARWPGRIDWSGGRRVWFGHRGNPAVPEDEIHLDEATGLIWYAHYLIGGGDQANYGGFRVHSFPLTPERAQLVADLEAEYAAPTALAKVTGHGVEAIEALLAAGWTAGQVRDLGSGAFVLASAADAAALLARTREEWTQAGWGWPTHRRETDGPAWTPTEAALVADAGQPRAQAAALHTAGHHTVDALAVASGPVLPEETTRVIIKTKTEQYVTDSVDLARTWLANNPGAQAGIIITSEPMTCVHAQDQWSLWSDGSLVRGVRWLTPTGTDHPAPRSLEAAAVAALELLAGASNGLPRPIWHPLRHATGHGQSVINQRDYRRGEAVASLVKHTFVHPAGTTNLWQAAITGTEPQRYTEYTVHADLAEAKAAYKALRPH